MSSLTVTCYHWLDSIILCHSFVNHSHQHSHVIIHSYHPSLSSFVSSYIRVIIHSCLLSTHASMDNLDVRRTTHDVDFYSVIYFILVSFDRILLVCESQFNLFAAASVRSNQHSCLLERSVSSLWSLDWFHESRIIITLILLNYKHTFNLLPFPPLQLGTSSRLIFAIPAFVLFHSGNNWRPICLMCLLINRF